MVNYILRIGLIALGLALAGCPDNNKSAAPAATPLQNAAFSSIVVTPNTGTVTVIADLYSVVSIGSTGANFKTVDAQGSAVFTGLTPGAVDVHVFSGDGYSATSYYGVNSNLINDSSGGAAPVVTAGSFIDTYVSIINEDIYGQRFELKTATNTYTSFGSGAVSGNQVIFRIPSPVGTVLTGELTVSQGNAHSSAGNILLEGRGEVISLGAQTFTTVTSPSFNATSNLVANFSATPNPPVLATINQFTLPAGHMIDNLVVSDVFVDTYTKAAVLPDTIRSADPRELFWFIQSQNISQTWAQGGSYNLGTTITPKVTFTAFPTLADQVGNTISWVNGVSSVQTSANVVFIDDVALTRSWAFIAQPDTNSITLPVVPAGVLSPLTTGVTYAVEVHNEIIPNVTIEQLITIDSSQTLSFEFSGTIASYTR